MAYMLPHLQNGWEVDQAILHQEQRIVVIRFGIEAHPSCMIMDQTLFKTAQYLVNVAAIYVVNIQKVNDFNVMYQLYDSVSVMFFYRNRHIQVDLGTGNNNKINWAIKQKQDFIDIVEIVYRGARKGKGLVVAVKDYSSKEIKY